jgi:hypothetical protein
MCQTNERQSEKTKQTPNILPRLSLLHARLIQLREPVCYNPSTANLAHTQTMAGNLDSSSDSSSSHVIPQRPLFPQDPYVWDTIDTWYEWQSTPSGNMWVGLLPPQESENGNGNGQLPTRPDPAPPSPSPSPDTDSMTLTLATWNVNKNLARALERTKALVSYIISLKNPSVDIIFLRGVLAHMLTVVKNMPQVQQRWFMADGKGLEPSSRGHQWPGIVTLMSKATFDRPADPWPTNSSSLVRPRLSHIRLSRRIAFLSRHALFCDILVPLPLSAADDNNNNNRGTSADNGIVRMRLANVCLEPKKPPTEPLNYNYYYHVSTIASYMTAGDGIGIVAGDFCPARDENDNLVGKYGFAWPICGATKQGCPAFTDKILTSGPVLLMMGTAMDAGSLKPLSDESGILFSFLPFRP